MASLYDNKNLSIMPSQNPEQTMLSLANILRPPPAQAAPVTATPAITEAVKPKRKSTVVATKGGPLDANAKKVAAKPTLDQEVDKAIDAQNPIELTQQESMQKFLTDSAAKLKGLPGDNTATQKYFQNLVPGPDDFVKALTQGDIGATVASGGPDSVKEDQVMNNAMMKEAMQSYLSKASNPYRGVDLENIDKLAASAFGSRIRGMKNVAEPVNEFNVLAGAVNNIQKDKQIRAKEVMDYTTSMLKPQLTGQVTAATQKPVSLGSIGAGQRAEASKERYVANKYLEVGNKNSETLRLMDQLDNNLASGDLTSLNSSMSVLAKTISKEVGNLAVKEAERFIPGGLDLTVSKIISYVKSDPQYKVPPDTLKAIKNYVGVARRELSKKAITDVESLYNTLDSTNEHRDINRQVGTRFVADFKARHAVPVEAPKGGRMQDLLNKARR